MKDEMIAQNREDIENSNQLSPAQKARALALLDAQEACKGKGKKLKRTREFTGQAVNVRHKA